jgi:hypothetical protein
MSQDLKRFVANWKAVGPQLEAMRDRELIETPLPLAMAQLDEMIDSAIFLKPLEPTSGLVEMQHILARLRR